jgi:hypothetical protein
MSLLARLQQDLDGHWAELSAQWQALDAKGAALQRQFEALGLASALREQRQHLGHEIAALMLQQADIVQAMDVILHELAELAMPRPELADPMRTSGEFALY